MRAENVTGRLNAIAEVIDVVALENNSNPHIYVMLSGRNWIVSCGVNTLARCEELSDALDTAEREAIARVKSALGPLGSDRLAKALRNLEAAKSRQ